jgi:hypothetical protein
MYVGDIEIIIVSGIYKVSVFVLYSIARSLNRRLLRLVKM